MSKPAPKLSTARLDPHKFSSPFASTAKAKTSFTEAYGRGDLPCRIEHHTSRMSLAWSHPVERLDYNGLLPLCFDGLRETKHPYAYIARQAVTDMLSAEGAEAKTVPVLDQLIPGLRMAMTDKDENVCKAALSTLGQLSAVVKAELDQHLHHFLTTLNRRLSEKKFREPVEELLQQLEQNGGKDVSKMIKQKIPTYTPLYR